jgi:toluene monooxygenase system ferredoxin subunit
MSWKRVCKATDVPENTLKKYWVDGIALIIVNYGSGFRAIPPICPHMEEPLEESGIIANCALTCSKHLWSWDLRSLDKLGETEKLLGTYEVKQDGDDVLAFVDKEIVYEFEDEDDMDDEDFFKQA